MKGYKTIKLLEDNIGENLAGLGLCFLCLMRDQFMDNSRGQIGSLPRPEVMSFSGIYQQTGVTQIDKQTDRDRGSKLNGKEAQTQALH